MQNKTTIQIMKERNFKIVDVDNTKRTFIFLYDGPDIERDGIFCEVYPDNKFNLIYTNRNMIGVLELGVKDRTKDDDFFERVLSGFTETVMVLKNHYKGNDYEY